MDSPHLQSIPSSSTHPTGQQQHSINQHQRVRTNSSLSVQSIDSRGAIRKRSTSRSRSISQATVERLRSLALEQASSGADFVSTPPVSSGLWLTPQHSPQPHFYPDPSVESFPQWTIPTPPRSDSGIPALNVDSSEESTTVCRTTSQDFSFEQPTTSAEMSSLGFLLPSQYGSEVYQSEPNTYSMEQNYPPMRMSAQQPPSTEASSYGQAISSSPALYQSRSMSHAIPRRQSEFSHPNPVDPAAYEQAYRRISNPYDSAQGYSVPQGQSIPPLSGLAQSPQPSPSMNASAPGSMSSYTVSRSPGMYDTSSMYGQQMTSSPPAPQVYAPSQQSMSYPPAFVGSSVNEVLARPMSNGDPSSIRVLNQRPKPQCWEHGCNGRQFSTFSNLLRHQREKSGTATKSYCPRCGAEFTRTTARNGHLAHDKCSKQRRQSEENIK